jgi:pimeloyl-ACP methyl ester carboxylesterase
MSIDLLWHGYSAKPDYVEGQDIQSYVAQVLDLLDAEGIDRAHIEGESLGGWIGLWLAIEHPDRVGKLILNTTAGIKWDEGSVETRPHEGREALAQRSLQAINDPNRETIRKRLEWLMATPDRVTDELVELRYSLYSTPEIQDSLRNVFGSAFGTGSVPRRMVPEARLAEITVPTLVFWSDHNPGAGPEVGRKIASLIPNAQFYCMDDAAHWPQWEHPEEHDRVITEFLRGGDVGQA